jgi:hypothetical protein
VNGPPTRPRPYIKSSIICAADGCSAAAAKPQQSKDAITNSPDAFEPTMASFRIRYQS